MYHTMSNKSQVWGSIALLCLVAAPAVATITGETGAEVAELRKTGAVAEAIVTGKHIEEKAYTDSKGRPKTTTQSIIALKMDGNTAIRYPEWLANGEVAPKAAPDAVMVSLNYNASGEEYAAASPGSPFPVVYSKIDSSILRSAAFVKEYNTNTYYLVAALLAVIGIAAAAMAWRSRKA
jgi:hypothetical protein